MWLMTQRDAKALKGPPLPVLSTVRQQYRRPGL